MTTLPKLVKPYNNYSPLNKTIKMTNTMYNNFSNYNYLKIKIIIFLIKVSNYNLTIL